MEHAENIGLFEGIADVRFSQPFRPDFSDDNVSETTEPAPVDAGPAFPLTQPNEHWCASFLADVRNEETIARWIHPEGIICPGCKKTITDPTISDRFFHLQGNEAEGFSWKDCRCPDCGKRFTPWTETLFDGAHNKRAAFMTLALAGFNVDLKFIARITGQHLDTVRNWVKRAHAVKESNV